MRRCALLVTAALAATLAAQEAAKQEVEPKRLLVAALDGDGKDAWTGYAVSDTLAWRLKRALKEGVVYDYEVLLVGLQRGLLRYAELNKETSARKLLEVTPAAYLLTGRVKSDDGKVKVDLALWRRDGESLKKQERHVEAESGDWEKAADAVSAAAADLLGWKLDRSALKGLTVSAAAFVDYGRMLRAKRDPETYAEAGETAAKLIRSGERGAAALYHAGWLYATRAGSVGDVEARIKLIDAAKKAFGAAGRKLAGTAGVQPYVARALNSLGLMHYAEEEPGDAERYFTLAVRADPRLAEAHHNLANVRRQLGKLDKALQAGAVAYRLMPEAGICIDMGAVFMDMMDRAVEAKDEAKKKESLTKAETWFRRAVSHDEDSLGAHQWLALVLDIQGRPKEALPHYRRYKQLGGADDTTLDRLDELEEKFGSDGEKK